MSELRERHISSRLNLRNKGACLFRRWARVKLLPQLRRLSVASPAPLNQGDFSVVRHQGA